MIPITKVEVSKAAKALVAEVLDSGLIAQGPKVEEFEEQCSQMAGTRSAVAVNSGTAALFLALRALEVGPGDEVITSPFTFAATLNAILETGATARFGDISDDYNLDMSSVEPLVNRSTRVLMPVHLYGLAADMEAASVISQKHGLSIIEDSAQAHFATTRTGRRVGSFGLGCFSFYATKNLMSGEGGVVTVDDTKLEKHMRTLRNQGMSSKYHYEMPGYNLRLTDLAAALVIPQFDVAEEMVHSRRQNAETLAEGLAEVPGILLPNTKATPGHVWHQYTIRLTSEAIIDRTALAAILAENEIGHGIYYPRAVYDYPCYRSHPRVVIDGSPRAEKAAENVLSIPVHHHLTKQQIKTIIETIRTALGATSSQH